MTIVQVVLAMISTGIFVSLSVYLYVIWHADSPLLQRLHLPSLPSGNHSKARTAFVAFVAMGFAICAYQGAHTMLFWLPDHWNFGSIGSIRNSIAMGFSLFGGLSLLSFTFQACDDRSRLDGARVCNAGLRQILQWSEHASLLDKLKEEFSEAIKALQGTRPEMTPDCALQQDRMIQIYRELIWLADNQKAKVGRLQG